MNKGLLQWLYIRKLERDVSKNMGDFGYDNIKVTFLTHVLPKDVVANLDKMLDLMEKEKNVKDNNIQ